VTLVLFLVLFEFIVLQLDSLFQLFVQQQLDSLFHRRRVPCIAAGFLIPSSSRYLHSSWIFSRCVVGISTTAQLAWIPTARNMATSRSVSASRGSKRQAVAAVATVPDEEEDGAEEEEHIEPGDETMELTEEERRMQRIAEMAAAKAAISVADKVADRVISKLEKKIMKTVDARLEGFLKTAEERAEARHLQLEQRLAALENGDTRSRTSHGGSTAAAASSDPWHDYLVNSKGRGRVEGGGAGSSNGGSATGGDGKAGGKGFVKSKVELKGFVQNWSQWQAESLTRYEAKEFLQKLFSALPDTTMQMVLKENSLGLNNKVHVPVLVIETIPGQAWPVCEQITSFLRGRGNEFHIKGHSLTVVTECAPWRKPTRQAIGRAMGTITKVLGFPKGELTSDGKLNPRCTIFREHEHLRPVPLVTWSASEGYRLVSGGIADSALADRLLAELSAAGN
jgi:hypothetical protein